MQFIAEAKSSIRIEMGSKGSGSNFQGELNSDDITPINISDAVGNEPGKSGAYFSRARVKHKMTRLIRAAKSGRLDAPVISTPHPADSTKHVIIDGHHRLHAHRVAGSKTISSYVASHDDVHLIGPNNTTHALSNFRSPTGSYDMDKQRSELSGLSLNDYFASINT